MHIDFPVGTTGIVSIPNKYANMGDISLIKMFWLEFIVWHKKIIDQSNYLYVQAIFNAIW